LVTNNRKVLLVQNESEGAVLSVAVECDNAGFSKQLHFNHPVLGIVQTLNFDFRVRRNPQPKMLRIAFALGFDRGLESFPQSRNLLI